MSERHGQPSRDRSTQSNMRVDILAFGSNGSGQLGVGHAEDLSSPCQMLVDTELASIKIDKIRSGGNHTITLYTDGRVATAGSNEHGQLLRTIQDPRTHISESLQVVSAGTISGKAACVAATWTASFVATRAGSLYCCGSGPSGELGLGPDVTLVKMPTVMAGFPPAGTAIVEMASCMGHVVVVLSNGEVWGWGKGRKGQLGMPAVDVWKPRKIQDIPFAVVGVACGKDFTCVFGHPPQGEVKMLGPNGRDRFEMASHTPNRVPGWQQVGASWGSVFVLFESGQLIGWGRDDHGQLPPENPPLLKAFAAGSEHCLALTQAGTVVAWGWGEHGNCGKEIDIKGDVKARWNTIELQRDAEAVYAGCATSFVAVSDVGIEAGNN